MSAESPWDESEPHGGGMRCPPPFPLFPIVFPMIFPIGVLTLLGRRRRRRERSVETRLGEVEKRLDDLADKVAAGED
ncbi:MAG TPA: hypothetical protein VM013_07150 [Dehalococcoidia bacterium]|nr:hypothetical protein [Dehalococcoidia bacterium]